MNLGQLQAAVQAYGYGTDTAAQQLVFINAAYREIHSKQRWPFLEAFDTSLSTTPGVNTVSIATLGGATPYRNIDAVRIFTDGTANSGQDMDYIQPQEMRTHETEYSDWSGKPTNWSIIDQTIHVWPFPDGVYTLGIDYIIEPPDLAISTDIPILPLPYHDVIVFGALKQIAMRERDLWSIGNYGAEYQRRLQEFEEEYFLRQRQTSSTVAHNPSKYGRFAQSGWIH